MSIIFCYCGVDVYPSHTKLKWLVYTLKNTKSDYLGWMTMKAMVQKHIETQYNLKASPPPFGEHGRSRDSQISHLAESSWGAIVPKQSTNWIPLLHTIAYNSQEPSLWTLKLLLWNIWRITYFSLCPSLQIVLPGILCFRKLRTTSQTFKWKTWEKNFQNL